MEGSIRANITVTHLNIRESISILLFKLISLDFIAATFTLLFFSLVSFSPTDSLSEKILSFNILFFVALGLLKISFTIYIILLWLNEYYEITPTKIIHKSGLVFRDEQQFQLVDVRTIKVYQGFLGKMFDFGTIGLHDIRRNKRVELYLIHNPHRYVRILEKLLENPHEEKHELRKHLFKRDEDDDDDDDDDDAKEGL